MSERRKSKLQLQRQVSEEDQGVFSYVGVKIQVSNDSVAKNGGHSIAQAAVWILNPSYKVTSEHHIGLEIGYGNGEMLQM